MFLAQCQGLSPSSAGSSGIASSSPCFLTRGSTLCHRSLLSEPGNLQRATGGDGDVHPIQTAPQSRGPCCTDASGTGPSLLGTQELLHFPVPVVRAGWPSTAATAKGLRGKLLPTWLPAFRPLCHILPVPHSFKLWMEIFTLPIGSTDHEDQGSCLYFFFVPPKSFSQFELTCKMRRDDI